MHTIIQTKYQKYPSTTILKHEMFLAEVNKLPYVRLPDTIPHDVEYYNPHMHNGYIIHYSQSKGVNTHYQMKRKLRHITK